MAGRPEAEQELDLERGRLASMRSRGRIKPLRLSLRLSAASLTGRLMVCSPPLGRAGGERVARLGQRQMGGNGDVGLRPDFEGRRPEMKLAIFPARLGHLERVGQLDQIDIASQTDALDLGRDAPEGQLERPVIPAGGVRGGDFVQSSLPGIPHALAVGAIQGHRIAAAFQIPTAVGAKGRDEGERPHGAACGCRAESVTAAARAVSTGAFSTPSITLAPTVYW